MQEPPPLSLSPLLQQGIVLMVVTVMIVTAIVTAIVTVMTAVKAHSWHLDVLGHAGHLMIESDCREMLFVWATIEAFAV